MNRFGMCVLALCLTLAGPAVLAQSPRLVGWWRLDDATNATVLADSSGQGRHAAKGSGVSMVDNGRFGKAARFDGTSAAWASFSNPLLTNMTLAAWVYMDGIPTNILPRIMQFGSDVYYLMPSNTLGQFSLGARGNNWSTSAQEPFKFVTNRWFHAAVVYRQHVTGETARVVSATFYINGLRCGDPGAKVPYTSDIPAGTAFFGNNSSGSGGIRPLNGLMDDVRLYNAPLSDREILALFQNKPLAADAGADQTVARARTALQGRLVSTNAFLRDFAAAVRWESAEAPAGAPPALATPWLPATEVTLPQPGAYVFRLTVSNELGSASDEVTVTRITSAPAENTAPAVAPLWPTTNTLLGAAAAVAATVTDDGLPGQPRLRWSKVSGPGAVFFDNPFTNATAASFSTSGTYVLALEADDGDRSGAGQVTVTVDDPGNSLTNGLLHWWRFDEEPGSRRSFDSSGTNTLNLLNQAVLQPGKSGFGLREPKPDAAAQATNVLSDADFMTFSAWFYHDNAYTNNPYMRLFNCGPNFYVLYNRALNQIDLSTTGIGTGSTNYTWGFPEAKLTSNQWFHIAVLFDRRPASGGSRQTLYLNGLRYRSNPFGSSPGGATTFPGAAPFAPHFVIGNTGPAGGTRNFDGVLDDLRVYNRFISDDEARLLAADPDNNHAPAIEGPVALTARVGVPTALQTTATDDGRPAGQAVVASWSVAEGEASKVFFADPSQPSTAATFTKTGEYVIMLAVSDGELQNAAFLRVTVLPSGTVLLAQ